MSGSHGARRQRLQTKAFTVLELLVAMAVLVLMLTLITQLFNSAVAVTTGGNKHSDADGQARAVLDRIGGDIARMVRRPDVDYYFNKTSGNDQMAFYTEATGYMPDGITGNVPKSSVSLAGYRINANFQLERLGKGLIWNGVTEATDGVASLSSEDKPMVFLPQTLTGTWPNVAGAGNDPDFQVIGDQIYRMEISFLLKPYSNAAGAAFPAVLSEDPWDTRQDHTTADGLRDVSAIVVTIAVLDSRSRVPLGNAAAVTAACQLLPLCCPT